jgi:thymidylate synthase (FAD)
MSWQADEIKDKYFPVLDHGFVALVDYMGGDIDIERAARISYGAGTRSTTDTRGLIRYLMRHKHTGPFEQVELKFHVKLPIFVARQYVRHRTASLNEYSLRYSLAPLQFYYPEREQVQYQSSDNKQGRSGVVSQEIYERVQELWRRACETSSEAYIAGLEDEVARELARLPLNVNVYTEWYWKIDLHNLFHALTLRCDPHAQWEIRQYAEVKAAMAKRVAPLAYEAWIDYALCARTFSRMELQAQYNYWTHGTPINEETLAALGMSKREIAEYIKATSTEPLAPSFELDLMQAKDPSYFEERARKAVPEIKKKDDSTARA